MLAYSFMQHAFISGFIITFVCGLTSVFVVLRRAAFTTHALSHTSLTGAAGALLLGQPGVVGQLVINIIASSIMAVLGDKVKKNDLTVGVVLTFFLGLGAYFLFLYQNNYTGGILSILFGNILAVSAAQIDVLLALGVFVVIAMLAIFRPLAMASIDPVMAKSQRIPSRVLNIIFHVLLAMTISMGCQVVGALLIFVLMVVPGAIAAQYGKKLGSMMVVSLAISISSVWLSLILAYFFNLPVSFCITMILSLSYVLKPLWDCCKPVSSGTSVVEKNEKLLID